MPAIIAKNCSQLYVYENFSCNYFKNRFLINVDEILSKYAHVVFSGNVVKLYLSRIFNEERKLVCEPRKFSSVDVIKASPRNNKTDADGYYIDVTELVEELSIPNGYYFEVLLITVGTKILFPFETKLFGDKDLLLQVTDRYTSLSKIGSISQSQNVLSKLGLKEVVDELSAGYADYEKGDTDGAIKHYRKVIEGFKNYLVQKEEVEGKFTYKVLIDNSPDRTEKVVDFLKKTYNLLSNFGEHYGTSAYDDERILANTIVEGLTEYLTKKMSRKS